MVKNISETVKVPASFLVDGFQGLSAEAKEKVILISQKQALSEAENKELDASEIAEVVALLPDKMKADLAHIGAMLPSDQVALTMRLGDFLYHVYAFNVKPTAAPLAAKRHEKRIMELAEILDKDEIDVPKEVLDVTEAVLSDDKKWQATQFGALLTVDGSNKYIGLSAFGASIFKKVLDAATGLCIESPK